MKNAFGTANTEELAKMGVSSEEFIKKIITEFEKLPPVSGSVGNSIENLGDTWWATWAEIGTAHLGAVQGLIDLFSSFIENQIPALVAGIETIIDYFLKNKDAIFILSGAILGALTPAIASFGLLAISLAPWVIGGAIIGGLVYGIIEWMGGWENLKNKIVEVWGMIAPIFLGIYDWLKVKLTEAMQYLSDFWEKNGDKIISIFTNVWEILKGIFELIILGYKIFVESATFILNQFGLDWGNVWEGIKIVAEGIWNHLKIALTEFFNFFTESYII
jgi:hypothetical protein